MKWTIQARRRVGGRLTGDAPRRVGQTTVGGVGRSVYVLVVRSLDDEAIYRRLRTVNRTALFRIDLGV